MTDWQRAWKYVTKPSKIRGKAAMRRLNHRANRRAGKALDTHYIRLNGWDVV
jgi:hypothetical protein